jgi:hypothetical protein
MAVPDDSAEKPVEISGVVTAQDVLDSLEVAQANYAGLIGRTPKRPHAVQFAKGLCIGLVLFVPVSVWLAPIMAALAGTSGSTGGWVPFISLCVACYLFAAANAGRTNRHRYKTLLDATRPDLAGAGATFMLRLAGPRIELRGTEPEQVWTHPAFTRVIEASSSFVLLAGNYVIPIPKRGLAPPVAADLRAWAERFAAGVTAPRPQPRYASRRGRQIAAWVILGGGLLPPVLQHARLRAQDSVDSPVRIALSGHAVRVGDETIPLEQETYSASLYNGALREWLAGCSYPGDGSTRFEIERYRPGLVALPPSEELQNQQRRFTDKQGGMPADAVASALPDDGVLITWSRPAADDHVSQCVFVRTYDGAMRGGRAAFPRYARTVALWSCSTSASVETLKKWTMTAAPVYGAELAATTQTTD